MPKIGTIRLFYEGADVNIHEIHYKQNAGFYVKGLSQEFKGLTDFPLYFQTEQALRDDLHAACRKYRELKKKSKMVILYRFEASAEICMNKVGDGSFSGFLNGVSRKIKCNSAGLPRATFGIDFKIASCVNDGVEKKYYGVKESDFAISQYTVRPEGYQEIDFSEERYAFFIHIVESMKKMVVSASSFFDADPDQAISFIENKQKLIS